MNTLTVIVILATVACSSAYLEKCSTDNPCKNDLCCVNYLKRCIPKIPLYGTCYLTAKHGCGCVSGSSCKKRVFAVGGRNFFFRQCVKDDVPEEKARRFLIRKCSAETVAEDCGKDRCCIGGKYCSPFIPKYFPCNFEDSHKCPCVKGLECKITKHLTIPGTMFTLNLKQCMPKEESVEVEEVEMTEE